MPASLARQSGNFVVTVMRVAPCDVDLDMAGPSGLSSKLQRRFAGTLAKEGLRRGSPDTVRAVVQLSGSLSMLSVAQPHLIRPMRVMVYPTLRYPSHQCEWQCRARSNALAVNCGNECTIKGIINNVMVAMSEAHWMSADCLGNRLPRFLRWAVLLPGRAWTATRSCQTL